VALLALAGCRTDDTIVYMEDEDMGIVAQKTEVAGMYVLCEGNMGSNKCQLDLLNIPAREYVQDIYPKANPSVVKELGDVGNDIQIYGSLLWIVVNCSNKVEVCDARTCVRKGQVNIPNCRYVAFHDGYAYVSSYVGPVQIDDHAQIGRVYKVDTLTLEIVGQVEVGYQPEELAVVGNRLYVANSGGYRVQNYDRTVSIIDLDTFTEERKVDVAVNLHRLQADKYGQVWVSSRGDYNTVPSRLYWMKDGSVGGSVDVPVSAMCIVGDSLYYIGTAWSNQTQKNTVRMGLVNVRTHEVIETDIFNSGEAKSITLPYGIVVHPETKDFYIMDAKNYVSSGSLLHFLPDGTFDRKWTTGDIPSRAVFVANTSLDPHKYEPRIDGTSPYIAAVDEYVPAPGQFVNTMPLYVDGDDAAAMARKCTEYLAGKESGSLVTLGGYGGYITFHFDHSVKNVPGEYDLLILGNALYQTGSTTGGSCEPGIVMVSQDTNNNGLPDDAWYELSGSADVDSVGKVIYGYQCTYTYTPMSDVPWSDNMGNSGTIDRNSFHSQEYFPLWLKDKGALIFNGTRLPDNAHKVGSQWILDVLRYGYVDNRPNVDTEGNSFKIDWAVDPVTRAKVSLQYVDFVRVYNGLNQKAGVIGETSTEICGAKDLHVE
jgi:hypothetical protein